MRPLLICWIVLLCALPARAGDRVMDVLDRNETPAEAAARLRQQALDQDRGARDAAPERRWNAEAASLRVTAPSGVIREIPPQEIPREVPREVPREQPRADFDFGGAGKDKDRIDKKDRHERAHRDHGRERDDDGERDD